MKMIGKIWFAYNQGKIKWFTEKFKEPFIEIQREFEWYDKISGLEFSQAIEDELIINYDGTMSDIIIDGKYKTNLGVYTENTSFMQGAFLVDLETFRELCEVFDSVEVNWANK